MDGYKKLVVISFLTLFSGSSLHAMSSQERTAAVKARLAKKVNKTTSQADNTQQAKTPETPDVKNTQDGAVPEGTTVQIKDFEALQQEVEKISMSLRAKQTTTSTSSEFPNLSSLDTTSFKEKLAAAAAAFKSLPFEENNLQLELKRAIQKSNGEMQILQKQAQGILKSLAAKQTTTSTSFETVITNLIEENSNQETALRGKQKELKELQEKIATLTFLKQNAEERATEWQVRYKNMQGVDIVERAKLQAAMAAEAMQHANDIAQYSHEEQVKAYSLTEKIKKQEEIISKLQSNDGLLSLQVKTLKEKQNNANKHITATHYTIQSQRMQIKKHEELIKWGKEELKKTEQERDRAQAAAEDALNTLRIGKQLLDEAQVKVANREQQLIADKMRNYVALDCAQIKATNDQQQKLTTENSVIKEQLRKTFTEIEELEQKLTHLQQLESTCHKIEQGMKKKDEQIGQLENERNEIEKRLRYTEIQVHLLENMEKTTRREKELEVKTFTQTIETLKINLTDSQSLQQEIAREAAEQKQALEDANRQLQTEKADIQEHLTGAGGTINQLQSCIQRNQQTINTKDAQLNRPFNRFGNSLQEFYERAALFAHTNRNQLVVGGAVGAGVLTYAALWHYNRAPLQKVITSAVAKQISPFTLPYTKPVADFCAQNISTPLTQGFANVSTFIGSLNASVKNNSYTFLNTVFLLQTR